MCALVSGILVTIVCSIDNESGSFVTNKNEDKLSRHELLLLVHVRYTFKRGACDECVWLQLNENLAALKKW